MKTPKTSRLFEKRINAESGAEYYVLKERACTYQQGFYFVNNSMTNDGRYLWFYAAVNPIYDGVQRGKMLGYVDFLEDEIVICYDALFDDASPVRLISPTVRAFSSAPPARTISPLSSATCRSRATSAKFPRI